MKKFGLKAASIFILFVCAWGLVPTFLGQNLGGTVRVLTVPSGPYFLVDGKVYTAPMAAVWPAGSKHTISVDHAVQNTGNKVEYTFGGWETNRGSAGTGLSVMVTADPSVSEYRANFSVRYALSVNYFRCPNPSECYSPGQIIVSGAPFRSDGEVYLPAGDYEVVAVPNPGFVFAGWADGPNQVIQGPVNRVSLKAPMSVYPRFTVARKVNLQTVPPGLEILADRTKILTPMVMEWGFGTTHSVSPVSPQHDLQGTWWVFSSWSDGGASTHAYTVGSSLQEETLTANFVRGAGAMFTTTPAGLKLKVDGRDSWQSYGFTWGVGETHRVEAPAEQKDAQGRTWKFSHWSNDGPAIQDVEITAAYLEYALRMNAVYTAVGSLTVVSSMPGLSVTVDGEDCTTPCQVSRPAGTAVRVNAPAMLPISDDSRAEFSGWPGGGTDEWEVTLNENPVTLRADYRVMNRLAASSNPSEGVVFNLQPESHDGFYDAKSMVNVTVSARPGYKFKIWSGDLAGTRPSAVISMSSPRWIQAVLDRVPYISPAGVKNAAGDTPDSVVAAGSAVAVLGESLAPELKVGPENPLAQTLGGVMARIGDRILPMFFVSPTQINLQLPDDLGEGSQSLTVIASGMPDVKANFTVVRNAPGLFQQFVEEEGFAVATHEDGSAVNAEAPARAGELLTLYGTGFGPTERPRLYGFAIPAQPEFRVLDAIQVLVGDVEVLAEKAFAQPGRVAVDVLQFRMPETLPSGDKLAIRVRINERESNTVQLVVQQ